MARKMPVLSITGPRQSGKTTLARLCFPGYNYVNLENPDTLRDAMSDPRLFLTSHKRGLIIDEAQLHPELFSYIQTISDESGKTGEYILTGSQNFLLSAKITQSLAGRVFITHLLPFSLDELKGSPYWSNNADKIIFNGFYPRLFGKNMTPQQFYPSYIQSYTERDVRQIVNISDLSLFQKFMRLAAGRTGQLTNYYSLSNELGIDHKTVKSWFSILEASFIVFFLQPHFKNFNKRLVKSPKLYFYDTGLACSLLGIKNAGEIKTHWAKGALFENLIVADLIKNYFNKAQRPPLYFWRDNTGNEVDCLVEEANAIHPVEIKSGTTIDNSFFKGINYYNKLNRSKNPGSYLVYGGSKSYERKEASVISWMDSSVITAK